MRHGRGVSSKSPPLGEDPPSGSRVLDERNCTEVGNTSRQVLVEDTRKSTRRALHATERTGRIASTVICSLILCCPSFLNERVDTPSCCRYTSSEVTSSDNSVTRGQINLIRPCRFVLSKYTVSVTRTFVNSCYSRDGFCEDCIK